MIVSFNTELCTILSTEEPGQCILLSDCQGLTDEYQKDRSKVPTICNKALRKVCCPLRLVPLENIKPEEPNITISEVESISDNFFDDSEPFVASFTIKSKFQI